MIKFFRHIRKNLLMENKTSKYFKYAIGEIILVMIGILLALQVSNWNEQRKENLEYQKFIIKLKSNLQDDINLYKKAIEDNTNHLKHLDTSLIILKNHKNYTTKDLQPHLAYIQYLSRFNSNNTAYINLQSTGKLNIITNDSLSDNLILYYRDITLQEKSITAGIDTYSRNTFGPLLLEFDFKSPSVEFGYKPLIAYAKNPKIVNSVELKSLMLKSIIASYTNQSKNAESIIKRINSEIKDD